MPLDSWIPDGNGEPRNAIHVRLQNRKPQLFVTRNDTTTLVDDVQWWVGWNQILTPSAVLRTRFELRSREITSGSVRWASTQLTRRTAIT